jgi:alkylation response protein AidB-like acyl-CoA dehydrogenase
MILDIFDLAAIPAEDEALRAPLRALLADAVHGLRADGRSRSWMGFDAALSRALGEAGYLGMTLPKQYGGQGRGAFARFVVVEELLSAGAPVAAHWIADRQSAPLILHYGTEAQRERYLPAICRGEAFFCIGMSEPGSGSDLASVRSRAKPASDGGWILDGQKIWTTYAHRADYCIALVRTSGTAADRQAGLSQFIVDLRLPGVTIRPIVDAAGDTHFAELFFDGVHLAADALIGAEGAGWAQVNAELAFERSGPERIYSSIVLLDTWIAHVHAAGRGEGSAILAGRLTAELAALRAMSLAVTAQLDQRQSPVVEASLVKDLGTSFEQSVAAEIADDLGRHPDEPVAPALLHALAYVTQMAPSFSLRGGTREILRGIIARGLGLR